MKQTLYSSVIGLLITVVFSTNLLSQTTTMDQLIGVNSRMEDPNERVNFAGMVREYHPWVYQEGFPALNAMNENASPGFPNALYKYNPSYQGQTYLNTDDYYQDLKNRGVEVVPAFLRSIPSITNPSSVPQDPAHARILDQLPITAGADPLDPASYVAHAHYLYNYAARYGNNVFSSAKTNEVITPFMHADESSSTGLGFLNYMENWNEQDKWWYTNQLPQTYFEPEEYAAMLSADYDGHMSTMELITDPDNSNQLISTVGIKNADPNMKMVMGGLSDLDTEYLEDMVAWFDANRSPATPFGQYPLDVINYHHYSDNIPTLNSFGQRPLSPEEELLRSQLEEIVLLRDQLLPGKELWLSEFGYDVHPTSTLGVPSIGANSEEEVQGQWIIRSFLEIAAAGFDRAMLFELRDDCTDQGCTIFSTSGLLRDKSYNYQPKISWYYTSTMSNVLENTVFDSDLSPTNCVDTLCSNECPRIYKFKNPTTAEEVYAIWSPTTCNKTYNYALNIGAGNSGQLIEMIAPSTNGVITNLSGNVVNVPVSERPVFIAVNQNLVTANNPCPLNLETEALSCDLIQVSWDASLSNQKVAVWYQKGLGQTFDVNNATLVNDNIASENGQYTISGLDFNANYSFFVFAEHSNGNMSGPCYVPGSTSNATCKINLTTAMVYESTGLGAAFYGVIDEQNLEPNCGTQSNAISAWGDNTGSTDNHVSIDLLEPYTLNAITFHDDVGVGTVSFQYANNASGPWTTITDYLTSGYNEWVTVTDFNLQADQAIQYFRVTMEANSNARIGELILCGETLNGDNGGMVIEGGNCDQNCPCKICIQESWITDLTPDDDLDPTRLVDEQNFIDPICSNVGGATTEWGEDWDAGNDFPPYQAILDLQQCYLVETIYLFDGNGSGLFSVEYQDLNGNWVLLESYTTAGWNIWHSIDVNEIIQNIRFTKHVNSAKINEVSICGLPVDCDQTCDIDADGDGMCADAECDDNNPTRTYNVGDTCDDSNPNTINDVINSNCNCEGTISSGNAPCTTTTNLALNGTATQSGSQQGGTANKLHDGNIDGNFYGGNSVNITSWVPNAFWEIDLGEVQKIEEINVYGREDCCTEFTSNYYIFISEVPFTSTNPAILLGQSNVTNYFEVAAAARPSFIDISTNGRYVRVQLAGTSFLSLAEVEIMGCDLGGIGTCPTAGTPCNDNDSCTSNDVQDGFCNCAGTFDDADNDSVCDLFDSCPGFDDLVDLNGNGTPDGCETGNPGTGNCTATTNLALAGTATQSGVQNGGSASKANDGNIDGNFWSGQSVVNTNWVSEAWWEIDLGSLKNIEQINVYNRTDCCTQFLSDYHIFVSDQPFTSSTVNGTTNQAGVSDFFQSGEAGTPDAIPLSRSGRYIRIQIDGTSFINIAEVEIMGCDLNDTGGCDPAGTICNDNDPCTINDVQDGLCNCAGIYQDTDNDTVCDANDICPNGNDTVDNNANGTPDDCDTPPSSGLCATSENLALNGTATQSGTQGGGTADRAIDGNTNGNYWSALSVINTNWVNEAYWEVDLGAIYNIDGINIFNRTDCCSQYLSDYHVFVSDVPFVATDVASTVAQASVTDFFQNGEAGTPTAVATNTTGRYVRIQIDAASLINIAEVEVMGCPASPVSSTYCSGNGLSTAYEYIDRITYQEIDNISGNNNGYLDATDLVANIQKGSFYSLTLTPGFTGLSTNVYWTGWMDLNQDGDFEDAGEQLFQDNGNVALSGAIQIPVTALDGITTFRIAMKAGTPTNDPCEVFSFGEIEDYSVNLSSNSGFIQPVEEQIESTFDFDLYPNPVKDLLVVQMMGENLETENQTTSYSIFNSLGIKIYSSNIDISREDQRFFIETNFLENGYYFLSIEKDGKNIGKSFIKIR